MAPPTGLEPVTPWLTVRCSTDWAKEECLKTLSAETVKLSASNNIFSQIGTHPNLFRLAKCRKYAKSQINKADDSGYPYIVCFMYVGYELSSRLVSKQVLLPLQSLTSVFGMGTGGPFAFETLTVKQAFRFSLPCRKPEQKEIIENWNSSNSPEQKFKPSIY